MKLFKENRFIFEETPGAPGEVVVPLAPQSGGEGTATGASADLEVGRAATDTQTDSRLSRLSSMVTDVFSKRIEHLQLDGKTFKVGVPDDLKFDSQDRKDLLKPQITEIWKNFDAEGFVTATSLDIGEYTPDEVKDSAAEVAATYILQRMGKHFEENYKKYYSEFIQENAKFAGKVDYEATFNKAVVAVKPVSTAGDFAAEYKAYVDKKYPGEKDAKAKEKSDKENLIQARADALEKSPLGKLLVAWKIVPEGGFADVIKGNNMFAVIIVGFFGGDKLLDGAYAKAKEGIDPKYAKIFEPFEKKAQSFPFLSVANLKVDEENPEGPSPVSFDAEKFEYLIRGEEGVKMPEQGLILKDEYPVPEGSKLIITNGVITLPKEQTLSIHEGDDVTAGDEPKVLQSVGPIIGKIPAGTMIAGTPTFKLEEISS